MSQANDSITVTPGTGATVATHLASGKEYQVIMKAGPTGHIEGSVPTYTMIIPDVTEAANKVFFDLWNGSASNIIKIQGMWVIGQSDVNGDVLSMRLNWFRTNTVGTGGTAFTYKNTAVGPTIFPKDTTNPALPAGVSARSAPAGGAATESYCDSSYHNADDTVTAMVNQFVNMIKDPTRGEQAFTLNPSEGFKAVQGTVSPSGAAAYTIFIDFSVE